MDICIIETKQKRPHVLLFSSTLQVFAFPYWALEATPVVNKVGGRVGVQSSDSWSWICTFVIFFSFSAIFALSRKIDGRRTTSALPRLQLRGPGGRGGERSQQFWRVPVCASSREPWLSLDTRTESAGRYPGLYNAMHQQCNSFSFLLFFWSRSCKSWCKKCSSTESANPGELFLKDLHAIWVCMCSFLCLVFRGSMFRVDP